MDFEDLLECVTGLWCNNLPIFVLIILLNKLVFNIINFIVKYH